MYFIANCVQLFVLTRQVLASVGRRFAQDLFDPMTCIEAAKGAARRRNYLTTAMML